MTFRTLPNLQLPVRICDVCYTKAAAGMISLMVVSACFSLTLDFAPGYFLNILISPNLILLFLLAFIISFYTHEFGHFLWGYFAGGRVDFFFNTNNFYIARINKYTKASLILFSFGGPATNILLATVLLLLLNTESVLIMDRLVFFLTLLNLTIGIGALIPISPHRGGLLYYRYHNSCSN